MKILTAALALLGATPALAAEMIYAPTAPGYTLVQIDSRKLKTTLAQALQAWPGKECTTPTDLNGVLNCPGVGLPGTMSLSFDPFGFFRSPTVTTVDANGRVRTEGAKVDGLRQKYWINARVFTGLRPSVLCPDGLTAIQQPEPPAVPIDVRPTVPLTEFGIEFATHPETPLTDIDVEVNGVVVGNYIVQPGTLQYVGAHAPEGITSIRFLPHDVLRGTKYGCNDSLTYEYGYVHGDRFFFQ